MGMVLVFVLFIYFAVGFSVYVFVRKKKLNKWFSGMILGLIIIIPTYDIILTNVLSAFYCQTRLSPVIDIKKGVYDPESVYFEDNIYEGFNERDRKLMIKNYLDGTKLKVLALNGKNGDVYVYEADLGLLDNLIFDEKYRDRYEQYAEMVFRKGKDYLKENMPRMDYTVEYDLIPLGDFERSYIYADEVKVFDNFNKELIAHKRRLMKRFYNFFPDISFGGRYFINESACGGGDIYRFDERVLGIKGRFAPLKHYTILNTHLSEKLIGENVNEY